MKKQKIKFVREYTDDQNAKIFDIIYYSRALLFVHEEDLPKTVINFMNTAARITKQYDYTALRKNKNEIIYEA